MQQHAAACTYEYAIRMSKPQVEIANFDAPYRAMPPHEGINDSQTANFDRVSLMRRGLCRGFACGAATALVIALPAIFFAPHSSARGATTTPTINNGSVPPISVPMLPAACTGWPSRARSFLADRPPPNKGLKISCSPADCRAPALLTIGGEHRFC